ncbi:hypothetical protein BL250_06755 [Erwinia sp. OLTSP20]|uniref:substrate-binding domain-containing protein n=1 Tax=unclassified Erwinia TaxID=2622719 RepID=UPI000C1A5C95|nr:MULTISPECIES: substrate-binding domain-containing protein [unclassified Erwinia]PIJ48586.1 hypothetical protein BV501_16590 [Erwinia sp. OAMSP11]PIJ68771.1 hypothetical protein BK416_16065 [Erwinia sp. OLSSP12]PIJ79335.1 hypothetical protein BLD47_14540 [Erwinia sp. OLCASP19]PIJ79518.1 hypothetical protein BLD46_16950 [Erwinia sp. OLMTSP26]PIJ81719.1 hypothetical protein BLD49_16205 [Erwinia sp. OLMDSP33]
MNVLAAGSLQGVWPCLMAHSPCTEAISQTRFGPAGLLLESVLAGSHCDLFASANQAHPQYLLTAGIAQYIRPFATNRLCLTVRSQACQHDDDWLTLLRRRDLRLATSTAGCDPSGDYALQLFDLIARDHPALARSLRQRALPLVGGRHSLSAPPGQLAASWLINQGHADMFIGYASYLPLLRQDPRLRVFTIPTRYNPPAIYTLAVLHPIAGELATYLTSAVAARVLSNAGFNQQQ